MSAATPLEGLFHQQQAEFRAFDGTLLPYSVTEEEVEQQAARSGTLFADGGDRAWIEMQGADAPDFLQRILTTEHASGEVRTRGQRVRERPKPYFYKFIDIFVNTQHPQVESALMQVLARRKDHDHITIQTTVIALGRMKSRAGAKMIQGMYFTPPPGQVANPLFRMKCLTAVMDTLSADATEFFREVERRETARGIRKKLDEYQKIVH